MSKESRVSVMVMDPRDPDADEVCMLCGGKSAVCLKPLPDALFVHGSYFCWECAGELQTKLNDAMSYEPKGAGDEQDG